MTEVPVPPEVDALYAGDPAGFVAGRDALVKQARAAKDRPRAEALKALRRPTVGAWYVNIAVRDGLTSLRELLRLGRELRDAQSALDFKAVVALAPRRADVERRVLRDLTAHLAQLGITASPAALEEVRSTLRAALTDAAAAAAVESGRLDRPLEYGGLGGFADAVGAMTAGAPEPEAAEAGHTEESEAEPAEGPEGPEGEPTDEPGPAPTEEPADEDQELATLERQAAAAQAALAAARAKREAAAREAAVRAARERLAAAERAAGAAQAEHDRLATQLGEAAERLSEAEDELAEAQAALAELDPPG